MGFSDFMNKVRYWDNRAAKWMMRHFYILFFEAFLAFIFLLFFFNCIQFIDLNADVSKDNLIARVFLLQTSNTLMIVLLLLLNSFWMLYIFNSITRLFPLLKDMNFYLSRSKETKER